MAAVAQNDTAVAGLEKDMAELRTGNTPAANSESTQVSAPPVLHLKNTVPLPQPSELSADQDSKYAALLETVKGWTDIPSAKGKEGPITDNEKIWLTRECLLRYLRATKWNTEDAAKRLLATLTWRREYGLDGFTGDYISNENETGKMIIFGYDVGGRPCLYLTPGRQNTDVGPKQIHATVFMLEKAIEFAPPGQETLTLLVNFKASKSRGNTAPGIGQGREVLSILQNHYPERLGRACVINIPWVVWGFLKMITPFIDPVTKSKLKFNEDTRQHVPPQQLWKEFSGDLDFEYDHDVYWPAFNQMCKEKEVARHERWVKGGKILGESEYYLKGGDAPSLGPPPAYLATVEAGASSIPEKQELHSGTAATAPVIPEAQDVIAA